MTRPLVERPNHAREIRYALGDPRALCESLGLLTGKGSFQRQAAGIIVRCPVHADRTPSCSVQVRNGLVLWRCHGCGATGDALTLIAAVRSLSVRRDFRAVLIDGAEIAGLHDIAHELRTGTTAPKRVSAPRVIPDPEPERGYPPDGELEALFGECVPVVEDPEIAAHLTNRAIDPELVDESRLAVALKRNARLPGRAWGYRGRPWTETGHRLILPVKDADGRVSSVRAWRVTDGDSPKRLPPGGYRAGGLVLACPIASTMLRGGYSPPRALIAEGEPDFLVAATWRLREPTAVLGVTSGAWSPALAAKFQPGSRVLIWTDLDEAGETYAREIRASLAPRGVFVERWCGEGEARDAG